MRASALHGVTRVTKNSSSQPLRGRKKYILSPAIEGGPVREELDGVRRVESDVLWY